MRGSGARAGPTTARESTAAESMKPPFWDEAARELSRRDRTLRRLIRAYPGIHLRRRADPFTTLARAIVGQQISVKAADAIWWRFVAAADNAPAHKFRRLPPAKVAATTMSALRTCGLSQRKAEYLADLAQHFASGRLDPKRWRKLDDEAVIAQLVDVKGIGRWTAQMFLMFHELRPDILPVDDLGLQKAVSRQFLKDARPTRDAMLALAEPWRPWRSVATWYLWRSLEPVPVDY
jgi:DNA-3-methyladenine glycosylase II